MNWTSLRNKLVEVHDFKNITNHFRKKSISLWRKQYRMSGNFAWVCICMLTETTFHLRMQSQIHERPGLLLCNNSVPKTLWSFSSSCVYVGGGWVPWISLAHLIIVGLERSRKQTIVTCPRLRSGSGHYRKWDPLPGGGRGPPLGIMIVVVISLSRAQEQKKDNDFSY